MNQAGYDLDFWAFGLVLVLTVPLLFGIRETKQVNNILTVIHVGVVVFIIIAGLTQAKVPTGHSSDCCRPLQNEVPRSRHGAGCDAAAHLFQWPGRLHHLCFRGKVLNETGSL